MRWGRLPLGAGTGYRYLLQPIGDATRVIGSINFTNIVRGAFQSCTLGYALDQASEGQALMTEALRAAIAEMFSPRVNLHRIQAAFRPENARSALLSIEIFLDAQDHLALELVEPLRTVLEVVIGARVRAADDHHDVVVVDDALVADRRLQQVPVLVDPRLQVDRVRQHGVSPPARRCT